MTIITILAWWAAFMAFFFLIGIFSAARSSQISRREQAAADAREVRRHG